MCRESGDHTGLRSKPTCVVKSRASDGLPSVTGFVQPELRLVQNGAGVVVDVEAFHCQDLADQMLRWSGRR